jgi:hypothetical protein
MAPTSARVIFASPVDKSVTAHAQHEVHEHEHAEQNNHQDCPFLDFSRHVVFYHPLDKTQNNHTDDEKYEPLA